MIGDVFWYGVARLFGGSVKLKNWISTTVIRPVFDTYRCSNENDREICMLIIVWLIEVFRPGYDCLMC